MQFPSRTFLIGFLVLIAALLLAIAVDVPGSWRTKEVPIQEKLAERQKEVETRSQFNTLVTDQLIEGRISLNTAAAMIWTANRHSPEFVQMVQSRYGNGSHEAGVAAALIDRIGNQLADDPPRQREVLQRLITASRFIYQEKHAASLKHWDSLFSGPPGVAKSQMADPMPMPKPMSML